jgi:Mce-associated membrane protein
MEGDAGASSRLNLTDADDSSLSEVTPEEQGSEGRADQTSTEVTPEEHGSEGGADQTSTEVTPEEQGSEGRADQTSTEVTPEAAGEDGAESAAAPDDEEGDQNGTAISAVPIGSRLGRGWFVAVALLLLFLAGGVGAGGYLALRHYRESQTIARNDAAALRAAEDCVAATQAPDTAAMADAARRIIECSTGDFGAQAALYSGMLTEAYQAANVHVQVSDMRAAVERNNKDGSIDVLVALRTKVSNVEAQDQEQGYRLRVTMSPADGRYKISKLDQVAK